MIRIYTLDSMPEAKEALGVFIRPYQFESAYMIAYVPHNEITPEWLGERSRFIKGEREVIKVRTGPALYDKIVIFQL